MSSVADELGELSDLGAVAVNAGELAQRIETNLERELAASTQNKYSRTLARLEAEQSGLVRSLERLDELCVALETGRVPGVSDSAQLAAEQLSSVRARRDVQREALGQCRRQIRATKALSDRFDAQNQLAFQRIEQSAQARALRATGDATVATVSNGGARGGGGGDAGGQPRAVERQFAAREQAIQLGMITPFENTNKMRTKLLSSRENSDLQWHEPALKPVFGAAKAKRKAPASEAPRKRRDADADDASDDGGDDFDPAADDDNVSVPKRRRASKKQAAAAAAEPQVWLDDGDPQRYCERLSAWWDEHVVAVHAAAGTEPPTRPLTLTQLIDAVSRHFAEAPSVDFDGGLRIPVSVHDKLFPYQRTAVRWLWELHCQDAGGIVGDEMGLGKTVTASAFLAALHASSMLDRPVLIACPATVLTQWTRELHRWYPPLRVVMMHSSGSAVASTKHLLRSASGRGGGVLLTTYDAIRRSGDLLQRQEWSYVILDEGHKIRNPNAAVTLACKALDTPHRIILSGAPIQNNLTELWSLFDFVFPGKLGTLPVFQSEFEVPIRLGGYSNASAFRVQAAYKCAVALRDLIRPYLLRRLKKDVMKELPEKTEQVLFCRLTDSQLRAYRSFIGSEQTASILEGSLNMLYGVDALRKICNHPDLLEHRQRSGELSLQQQPRHSRARKASRRDDDDDEEEEEEAEEEEDDELAPPDEDDDDGDDERDRQARLDEARRRAAAERDDGGAGAVDEAALPYGAWQKSAKLRVLDRLLGVWHREGRKALLFAQTRQMLDIVQAFVQSRGYEYRRMDGTTPIAARQARIDEFNNDARVFVFVLTTKVGGLGVNLIGADRIVIIDPDWNPATDVQARERAWRIGQTRHVVIYRLLTSGTIEEKIYHRQIYKQFLQNKILKDPKQQRFLKERSMADLFRLGAEYGNAGSSVKQQARAALGRTETGEMFASIGGEIMPRDIADDDDDDDDDAAAAAVERMAADEREEGEVDDVRVEDANDDEPAVEDENAAVEAANGGDGSRILRLLFDEGGVHSALSHDAIEQGASETTLVEKEASEIANRAVAQLRLSRAECLAAPINEPTWTGRAGSAGVPKARFGSAPRNASAGAAPSSSALLSRLKALSSSSDAPVAPLQFVAPSTVQPALSARASSGRLAQMALSRENSLSDARLAADPFSEKGSTTSKIATALLSYLRSRPFHCAPTAEIAAHFESSVVAQAQHVFRELLKQVAQFDKASRVWRLRAQYELPVE